MVKEYYTNHEKSKQEPCREEDAQTHQADDCVFVEEQIAFVMQETIEGYDKRNEKHRQVANEQEDEWANVLTTATAHEEILAADRKTLPIYAYRDEFLAAAANDHPVLIVVGESETGKTTQIPQYLHEIGRYTTSSNTSELGGNTKMKICCTLPSRVATLNAAARVANEMNVQVGEQVGYSTRFEHCTSQETIIQYMTDEMLLREVLMTQATPDAALTDYSCIVVDDAHERTLYTDLLFGILHDIIFRRGRSDLKLIVISATLDAEKVSKFFDDASIFMIPGRMFPVDIYYTKAPEADHVDAAIATVLQIHETQPLNGHLLVFLTCQEEIETAVQILKRRARNLGSHTPKLAICPMNANSPIKKQQQFKIFEKRRRARKVVLATNMTDLPIDGICYVIDTGFCRHTTFSALSGTESLVLSPISQAAAKQRAASAGRTKPGKCYRLYTESSFQNERDPNTVPEILRTRDMAHVVLMLKSLGMNDVLHFNFMDKPPTDALLSAIDHLYALGALNERGELTHLGRRMANFPPDTSSEDEPGTISYALLVPILFASFVDAMSMMLVPPSLFFYVIEQGGSYESYGIVLSAFSLSSFSLKLVFGVWSDKAGGKVRKQYLTAFGLAAMGGVVYFLASCRNMPGKFSVALIFLARFLGGCGSAHITLGYTYFARVLNKRLLTRACTMLHFLRAIGIFLSFAINVMLHKINSTVVVGSYAMELTPLNSVGFVLFIANFLVFAVLALHLQEPHDTHLVADTLPPPSANSVTLDMENSLSHDQFDKGQTVSESSSFDWRSIHRCEIFLPIWTCFNLFAGFQLIETAMTPAVNDALGWGPVGASALYSGMAVLALPGFIATFELSRRGARDELLVSSGLVIAVVGYTMMYLLWTHAATPILFCLPLIVVLEFPLVQGPTYSIYSAVIGRNPALKHHLGFMQAIMIMADSIPGLVLPSFITAFVLREPQDVVASSQGRELSHLALYAPILSLITLVGVWYVHCGKRQVGRSSSLKANGGEEMVNLDESVGLLQTVQRS